MEPTPNAQQLSADAAKHRFQGMPSGLKSNWPIWLVAAVVFANGLLSVVTMLAVRFEEPARLFNAPMPFGVHHASRLLTLVFGFELIYLSFQVLQLPGHRERGFSLGDFNRTYLNETPLVAVRDQEGHMVAFVNVIPSYRAGEATIDLMRHKLDVPSGTMDFLFSELLTLLKAEGYRLFNLGMAPFAGVGLEPDAPLQERAAHELSEQLERWVGYKGIRQYKAKFDPIWEDRFMIYEGGPIGLVKTGLALTRAVEG